MFAVNKNLAMDQLNLRITYLPTCKNDVGTFLFQECLFVWPLPVVESKNTL